MQESATGMMRKFYGAEVAAPAEWLAWQELIGFGANELLGTVISEARALGSDIENGLTQLLVQSGTYLNSTLPETLTQIVPLLKEKLAAVELRKRFGEPESLLAVPVYMELAQMDVEAHLMLQESAGQIENVITQFTEQVSQSMQLFIAERINNVESELTMHDQALTTSTQISSETTGGLDDEMEMYKPKFDQKKQQLLTSRQSLMGLWEKVSGVFGNLTQNVHAPVINSIEQSSAPTLMAA